MAVAVPQQQQQEAELCPVVLEWGVKGENLTIDEENPFTVSKTDGSDWQSIYSLQTFNYKKYKNKCIQFKIKIEKSNFNQIIIGVIDNTRVVNNWFISKQDDKKTDDKDKDKKDKASEDKDKEKEKTSKFYAIYGMNGWRNSHTTDYTWQHDWSKKMKYFQFKTGDEIILELNFFMKRLRFHRNNRYIGTIFENIDCHKHTKYRLAISLIHKEDKLTYIPNKLLDISRLDGIGNELKDKDEFPIVYKYQTLEYTKLLFKETNCVSDVKNGIIKEQQENFNNLIDVDSKRVIVNLKGKVLDDKVMYNNK